MPDNATARLLADLEAQGLLPPAQAQAIAEAERTRPFSVHYELRALLYLGVTLLAGGLGVLIYEHIDTIGHQVIIGLIALLMAACFAYVERHRAPFTWSEAPPASVAATYLLVLGCLLFVSLETYLQVQYGVFGQRYGLATLLPALVFFPLAYRHDHRGVLALAITALAAWVGVSVAPLAMFTQGSGFWTDTLSRPALLLGLGLVAAGLLSEQLRRKRHFAYTYLLLGSNVALAAAMTLLVKTDDAGAVVWWLLVLGLAAGLVWYARRTQSYLFLLLGVVYAYAAVTYAVYKLLVLLDGSGALVFYVGMLYLLGSAIFVIFFFINMKRILRLA